MSKDLTPREFHLMSLQRVKETEKSSTHENLAWYVRDKRAFAPDYEDAITKEFPVLSFFLKGFISTYEHRYKEDSDADKVIRAVEERLADLFRYDNGQDLRYHNVNPMDDISFNFIKDWYIGDGKYHDTENNRKMFITMEHMISRIKEKNISMEIIEEEIEEER